MTVEYWNPGEFDETVLPHGHYFDKMGSIEPEYARLPMTDWSKERIVAYVNQCNLIPDTARRIIEAMPLADLRAIGLKYVGTFITGSVKFYKQKHTKFYSLDVEVLSKLGVDA